MVDFMSDGTRANRAVLGLTGAEGAGDRGRVDRVPLPPAPVGPRTTCVPLTNEQASRRVGAPACVVFYLATRP